MTFWEKDIETLQRAGIEKLQVEKLKKTIGLAGQSAYYHDLFAKLEIKPGYIKNIEDITKLPFTTKQDLRDHFPYGFLAVDSREVVRLHSS
jgi:phenylacetate-CoA ligase